MPSRVHSVRYLCCTRAKSSRERERERDRAETHVAGLGVVCCELGVGFCFCLLLGITVNMLRERTEHCKHVTGKGRYVGQRLHTRVDSVNILVTPVRNGSREAHALAPRRPPLQLRRQRKWQSPLCPRAGRSAATRGSPDQPDQEEHSESGPQSRRQLPGAAAALHRAASAPCRRHSRRERVVLPVPPVRRRLHRAVEPWPQVLPLQCRSERHAWCATRLMSWPGFGGAALPESHQIAGASPSRPYWATTRFPTEIMTRRR
jgi:hypothetical protein